MDTIQTVITNDMNQLVEILSQISDAHGRLLIGIDGLMKSGKTSLSLLLSDRLGIPVIELDNFRDSSERTAYVERIYTDYVRECVNCLMKTYGHAIIEGVCLNDISMRAGLAISYRIFVQTLSPILNNVEPAALFDETRIASYVAAMSSALQSQDPIAVEVLHYIQRDRPDLSAEIRFRATEQWLEHERTLLARPYGPLAIRSPYGRQS